jgi:hypothetical protein
MHIVPIANSSDSRLVQKPTAKAAESRTSVIGTAFRLDMSYATALRRTIDVVPAVAGSSRITARLG